MEAVHVRREPFGRFTVVRKLVPVADRKSCRWCGSRPGRFIYGVDHDSVSPRTAWSREAFCSIDCHESYHASW